MKKQNTEDHPCPLTEKNKVGWSQKKWNSCWCFKLKRKKRKEKRQLTSQRRKKERMGMMQKHHSKDLQTFSPSQKQQENQEKLSKSTFLELWKLIQNLQQSKQCSFKKKSCILGRKRALQGFNVPLFPFFLPCSSSTVSLKINIPQLFYKPIV